MIESMLINREDYSGELGEVFILDLVLGTFEIEGIEGIFRAKRHPDYADDGLWWVIGPEGEKWLGLERDGEFTFSDGNTSRESYSIYAAFAKWAWLTF